MKKYLSKFFLGVFALSMVTMVACGEEKEGEEDDKKEDGKDEAALVITMNELA